MKLYERFGDNGYHTSITTTFGIDFDAYENAALSRLVGAKCRNNVLVTDAGMLSLALSEESLLPHQAGISYSVSGASAKGVFHPKIFLQFGRDAGRLIIGSANMTACGLAGNLELAGQIKCTDEDSGEKRIIQDAWRYVSRFLDHERADIRYHQDWMSRRTPWIDDQTDSTSPVTLKDGTKAAFLSSGRDKGIARQFIEMIGTTPIRRLFIISPYWDEELTALRYLTEKLKPDQTILMIEPERRSFPSTAITSFANIKLLDFSKFKEGRFAHAKLIFAETDEDDHVLYGSVNCTIAALGNENFTGLNEETALYRVLPKGSLLETLGLDKALPEMPDILPSSLSPLLIDESLEKELIAQKSAGKFESSFDSIRWSPPSFANPDQCRIELMDVKGKPIECELQKTGSDKNYQRFRIVGSAERPVFARLIFKNGEKSSHAVVSSLEALRNAIREPMSKRTEDAHAFLLTEDENGISLELLEIMGAIESPEEATEKNKLIKRKKGNETQSNYDYDGGKSLSYEDFTAGRKLLNPDNSSQLTTNTLAGTSLNSIRDFLNRILSLQVENTISQEELDDGDIKKAFDTNTENPDEDDDLSENINLEKKIADPVLMDQTEAQIFSKRIREDELNIVKKVDEFNKNMKLKADAGKFKASELLRLRVALSMVTNSSWNEDKNQPKHRQSHHVLATNSESNAWPRIMGTILFTVFMGKNAIIRKLSIQNSLTQIPRDFIECWATCVWCALAILQTASTGNDVTSRTAESLCHNVYLLTGLSKAEYSEEYFCQIIEAMSKKHCKRLGLDPSLMMQSHKKAITQYLV